LYKVLAVSVLLCGSETLAMGKKDESRIEVPEIKFIWSVKGCTRQEQRLNEIRQEMQLNSVKEKNTNQTEYNI
jgi:hypothetical protein